MDYSKRPGDKIEKIGELVKKSKPTISIVTPTFGLPADKQFRFS